jgi:hypothetical protein
VYRCDGVKIVDHHEVVVFIEKLRRYFSPCDLTEYAIVHKFPPEKNR